MTVPEGVRSAAGTRFRQLVLTENDRLRKRWNPAFPEFFEVSVFVDERKRYIDLCVVHRGGIEIYRVSEIHVRPAGTLVISERLNPVVARIMQATYHGQTPAYTLRVGQSTEEAVAMWERFAKDTTSVVECIACSTHACERLRVPDIVTAMAAAPPYSARFRALWDTMLRR